MANNGANDNIHSAEPENSTNLILPLQIGGKDVKTNITFDVVNPSTGKVIWKQYSATKDDAVKAAETAQAAFSAWSRTKPSKRRDFLLRAADIMIERAEELGGYMMAETGAQRSFATEFNVNTAANLLKDMAGRIATITATVPICEDENTSSIVYKEPYGVILGSAPWNAPYILGVRSVAYAIAAGNTAILKAHELSPRCFWAIGSVFKEAGLPDGVLSVLAHRSQDAAEITTILIEHPAVKKINFTGSTAVGSIIASIAGKNLKPCLLELGGKASAIVLPDANLKKAAKSCAFGAFLHSGQVCMSTERIIVHSSILSDFSSAFKDAVNTHFGSDAPSPVLITSAGVKKTHNLVSQAVGKGATLQYGDINAKESSGTRMRPIVVEGVKKSMDLFYQESFGPSVSLHVVESEEEAIALANDTEYGLSAAIFTENLATGLRVAKQIESGAVHINSMTVHDEASLPHGGIKNSGWGRFNASAGIEEFLKLKTVTWQDS